MSFLRFCLKNPVFASVIGLFILLFGCIALYKIPYQLLPQITHPTISVYTSWNGASPYEIEKEITQKQEKYLKNLPGLLSMTSTSREGMSIINLEFSLDTDLEMAFINVSSKLEEIGNYRENIKKPIIKTTGEMVPVAVYLFIKARDFANHIDTYRNFIEDNILQYYERIEGVGEAYLSGGTQNQIQIFLNAQRLAFNNITIQEVIQAIYAQNLNISAGSIDFNQRNYRIQAIGAYASLVEILNTIIKVQNGKITRLRDIADVRKGYSKKTNYNIHNGQNVISIQIRPTTNANILELTNKVYDVTQKLNNSILQQEGIYIDWGRDQRQFILDAIAQVKQSVILGVILSVGVLLLFLRNFTSLIVVSLVIPLSIIGTFIFLHAFGRTLNVISLAGIAFAVSMVIDAAIVVLESIVRNRRKNPTEPLESTIIGTKEVFGALFASSVTTIAIFIPILYLKDEAGQLFADIALASSGAIMLAFVISIFIIPSLLFLLLPKTQKPQPQISKKIGAFGLRAQDFIMRFVRICTQSKKNRIKSIVIFLGVSIGFSFLAFPKVDYMPKGEQNFIIAYISTPPGISLNEKHYISELLYEEITPFLEQNGYVQESIKDPPAIRDFFMSVDNTIYFYLVASDDKKARALIPFAKNIINQIPNASGVVLQQEIFSGSSSSSVDLNISGENLDSITKAAQEIFALINEKLPYMGVRAVPALYANNREINLYPNSFALLQNGLDIESFGDILEVTLGGKKVGNVRIDNEYSDLILKSAQNRDDLAPEGFLYSQIYTPNGKIIPLGSLVEVRNEVGISTIRHFEQKRNILLILNPNGNAPLEEVIETIQSQILDPIKDQFSDLSITLNGNADKLSKLRADLSWGFVLAIVITYLILCALYGSFFYPFFIILTIPLATAGGIMGLFFVNSFIAPQNLDVVTMLGFIILVGSVVNNAILIVYQARINFNSYQMSWEDSVLDSTRTRLSPIYMSMATSVLALLPLVIFSGAGSEIYRGLGAVLIGGLVFSTIITVFIIPALLLSIPPKINQIDIQEFFRVAKIKLTEFKLSDIKLLKDKFVEKLANIDFKKIKSVNFKLIKLAIIEFIKPRFLEFKLKVAKIAQRLKSLKKDRK